MGTIIPARIYPLSKLMSTRAERVDTLSLGNVIELGCLTDMQV
jgi:hypothetical protein